MRSSFSDIARPKAAAKQLSRLSPAVTLAAAQEALARASGYRDWHELAGSVHYQPDASRVCFPELLQLVLSLSDALDLDTGDVQFAISKAKLIQSLSWSVEDQAAFQMAAIREKFLGSQARGKPGTIVRVKAHGTIRPAYLIRPGRPTYVFYDSGEGSCGDFEAVTPRTPIDDFLPARLWLPYGVWKLEDGSEVAFARDYLPLWRVTVEGIERLDPWLWIRGIKSERWFAHNTERDWWRPAGRKPALAYLAQHRIFELPRLANAMPDIFAPGVETILDAVRRMHIRAPEADLPNFAVLNTNLLHDWRATQTVTES
jgi:hypothetical protein